MNCIQTGVAYPFDNEFFHLFQACAGLTDSPSRLAIWDTWNVFTQIRDYIASNSNTRNNDFWVNSLVYEKGV